MDISLALRKVRFEKGLKQSDVAKKIKVSPSFLSQLENGKRNPSQKMTEKLCKVYGVPLIVMAWYGMEEKDVQPKKKEAFNLLKAPLDNLISEFLK